MNSRKWLLMLAFSLYLGIPGVALAQKSTQPATASRAAPSRVVVINLMPRNKDEFRPIYGKEATRAQLNEMRETQWRLEQSNAQVFRFDSQARTKNGFESQVLQANEKTIIVIAHQENGKIRFVDGKSQGLAETERFLREQNKQGVFLTCDASDWLQQSPGPTGTLANRNVPGIITSIGQIIDRNPSILGGPLSFDDITSTQSAIDTSWLSNITPAVKGASAIAGLGGTTYVVQRLARKKR